MGLGVRVGVRVKVWAGVWARVWVRAAQPAEAVDGPRPESLRHKVQPLDHVRAPRTLALERARRLSVGRRGHRRDEADVALAW